MAGTSKRARVMGRSARVGHCICDPRKPCPCDVFLEQDVCLCAGERLPDADSPTESIALTKLVKNAGCASKIPPAYLASILSRLPRIEDPRLLVGSHTADDAGVFEIAPDLLLVQTVDVFAPCVDDPYEFGQIAACNSLSDCYAMGGTPLTAMSVIGYPAHTLSDEWMCQILRGGMDKLAEADVVLVGGHSANDDDIRFGFAVTGIASQADLITNAGAQPGDLLILTKPLGTGIVAFASQVGRASEEDKRASAASMMMLNRAASQVMREVGAHACTDVTGFGLLGHLRHMVCASRVTAEVWWERLPLFEGIGGYALDGLVSGAAERNREFAGELTEVGEATPEWVLDVLYDPQTSGGLLISVAATSAEPTVSRLKSLGCTESAVVGQVTEESEGRILVKKADESAASDAVSGSPARDRAAQDDIASAASRSVPVAEANTEECCAPGSAPADASETQRRFSQFMGAAFGPGALDVVQKELVTIALSVATRCEPCLKVHLDKAEKMGISADEVKEAAWMGVAFGGASAMMFWTEASKLLLDDEGA